MSQQQPQPDSPATTVTVTYVGCFKEQIQNPDLDGEPSLSISRAEACFTHCSIGTWSFAAIRNGTICTCGDSEHRKYGSAPESSCSTKCPENQSAFDVCGGPEANSIYYVGAMTPKIPWPTPSINPTNPNAIITPPTSDDGGGGDRDGNNGMLGNTKHASTAVIASVAAVAGVAVLAFAMLLVHRRKNKGRRSMSSMEDGGSGHTSNCRFDRHDKGGRLDRNKNNNNSNNNSNASAMIDPYSHARTGHSWFVTGHRDLAMGDIDSLDGIDNDDDSAGGGWGKEYLTHGGSKKEHQDLFAGFESSAMDEDRLTPIHPSEVHRHRSIETAPNTNSLSVANGPAIIHHDSISTTSTTSDDASSTTSSFPLSQPNKSSFATKLGLKMGHLKVKVPTHHYDGSNPAGTTDNNVPVAPISPISPISPTSRSSSTSSSSTAPPGFNDNHISATTTGYLDIEGVTGGTERSPTSATPSFSFASAPVPGPASNLQEAKKSTYPLSNSNSNSYKHQYQQHRHEPPSPISPQKQSVPSPTSPRHHLQGGISSRHQKRQHRSDMIKDLILQGDSALEDKELALMAQYQPHHCWQQQHQASAAAAAAAAITPTMPPKAIRRASLEPVEKPSLDPPKTTASAVQVPAALIIPSPRDYLTPPPRILVHKAL
ncbi:hypothetical protein BGZ96_006365 [Linnemannia gamsii]|uniref:WSC domain-containing protein n=1 Tax=Linnemannia gamsii TaxID=64522 RepID=A0ABQ7K3M3_9FUNG|nr:hypothetical protein BGZ96_006365 [Linnemannia gamsii]